MNIRQKLAPCFHREVQHHIAQEDHINGLPERQRSKEICLPEVTHLPYLRLGLPILPDVIEIPHHETSGKTAIDLDTMIDPRTSPMDHFGRDICSFYLDIPAHEKREVLLHEHRQTISLLAAGTSCTPEAKASRHPSFLNQFGQ